MFKVVSLDEHYIYIDTGEAEPAGYLLSRVSYKDPQPGDDILFDVRKDGSFTIDLDPASIPSPAPVQEEKTLVFPEVPDSLQEETASSGEEPVEGRVKQETEDPLETAGSASTAVLEALTDGTEELPVLEGSSKASDVKKDRKSRKKKYDENDPAFKPNARQGFQISHIVIFSLVLAVVAVLSNWIPGLGYVSVWLGLFASLLGILGLFRTKGRLFAVLTLVVAAASIPISLFAQRIISGTQEAVEDARKNSTQTILQEDLDITFGTWSDTVDETGLHATDLPVTISAKKDLSGKAYTIHVEAVDSTGSLISDSYLLVEGPGQGESVEQNAFAYVEEDKLEAMKTASFRVDEITVVDRNAQ